MTYGVYFWKSVWRLIRRLKESDVNVNALVNRALLSYVGENSGDEELRLEAEVELLRDELDRVHGWQKSIVAHGSGARAYLEKVRGGEVFDRSPFFEREPGMEYSVEDRRIVEKVVWYRELLAKKLRRAVCRLLRLKMEENRSFQGLQRLFDGDADAGENVV